MNAYTNECRPVYLLQPNELPPILEPAYQGYGNFGGTNVFAWLATHNLSPDKLEGLSKDMVQNYGILLDTGTYCVDQETGRSWACELHVKPLQLGLSTFPHYGAVVIDNKTPNELIESGRWVKKPMTELIGAIKYPLKFSFDQNAVYEDWSASENCPRQGYF
jgi:hypothetical protein